MRAARSACASCAPSSTSSKATGTSAREQRRAAARAGSIGILGGSFDPPHRGHVALARHARAELGLEHVLLMPAYRAPHKDEQGGTDPARRLRMCQLALAGEEGLGACGLEIERGGTSYTVDTLEAVHAKHPGARLTLIVGADTAATLDGWREPARLLELAELAVAARAGAGRGRVLDAVARAAGVLAPGAVAPVRFLEMPEIDASSSAVRERVARGEAIEPLVGPAVAAYIEEHRLYRPRGGVPSDAG